MPCPGSTRDGCRCPEHHPGLSAYSRDPEAFLQALEALAPVSLHIVTPGPVPDDPCEGGMLCGCAACVKERVGRKPRAVRQPWEPKAA